MVWEERQVIFNRLMFGMNFYAIRTIDESPTLYRVWNWNFYFYSTVTLLAKFLGLSTSRPRATLR